MEGEPPPNLEIILSFRRAKMVAKCTSAGQFTGQRSIGELLLLNKGRKQKSLVGQPLIPPRNLVKLHPQA